MSAADGPQPAADDLMKPAEVADLFRVDPRTVARWASAGRLDAVRTPGGHRRFRRSRVEALLRGDSPQGGESRG